MDRSKIESQESTTPSTALAYLDPHYWDQRFSSEEHYEWFKDYSHFQHLIQDHVKSTDSVLELGCGNSQFCEELYKDGITKITCIDLSAVAVENMQKRLLAKGHKDIKVLEADMLDLPFEDECFDVIIEKGTMPHFRRPLFEAPKFTWSMKWSTFGDGFHYFFYTLKKGSRSLDCKESSESFNGPSICLLQEELDDEDYIFRTNVDELDT
ncbi:S-adenosyl-L-methionine-dependent methyltransferases superfamily protein isoform X2 [Tasmannia lanceolata]|uniref:S-adenosyl-L-methionine-dependent methyltransferases superfamily protein isoform X2 n=1 Tax=Tasmannia lanceolata TaxID=3420 RepID=UPI0040648BD3